MQINIKKYLSLKTDLLFPIKIISVLVHNESKCMLRDDV